MKKKLAIAALGIIFLMTAIYLLFSNKFHYDELHRVKPEDLSVTDYVELESGEIIKQVISIDRDIGYLKEIEVIYLYDEEDNAVLSVQILKNGKNIKAIHYPVKQTETDEWTGIPIGKTLYPGCEYEIVFSLQSNNGNDILYLATQEIDKASPYNRQLLLNDELQYKSLAISYDFYDVIPFDMKLFVSILCLFLVGGIGSFLFQKNYVDLYAESIIPAILLLMLIPIFIISIYSRPCVDDFNYSKETHQLVETGNYNVIELVKAAFETDKHFYQTWQGLYTSAFFLALQPGIFGGGILYFIGVVCLLIFMYITLYLSIWIVKKRFCENRKKTWLWSLLLFSVIVQGLPSAVEGLYWYNGAVNYMPFVFLTFLNMALMLEYAFSKGAKSIICTVVSALLSFIISGGNHVTSFLNIMGLLIVCIILLPKKKIGALLSMVSALLGFWIMYNAPGTASRWNACEQSTALITIIESGKKCLENMINWMNIQWVCYLLLLLPFAFEVVYHCKEKKLKYHPLMLLSVSIIMLCGMQCVPYYAMSDYGAGRLQNIIWVAFIIFSGINVVYLLVWLEHKRNFTFIENYKNFKFSFYAVICSLILCWSGNSGLSTSIQAANEMLSTGSAQKFAFAFDERNDLLENSPDNEVIYVKPLPDSPLLRLDDISWDINSWKNITWREYYGKTVVTYGQ